MASKRNGVPHTWEGGYIKAEMQRCLNREIDRLSHGTQKRMRYSAQWYASDIVLKCGYIITGWPEDVPFTDLSAVGGGIDTLREIRRRWYLPDGDPEKLRFEPASRKDYANAARDPESVHPTPHHLPELKARAAATSTKAKSLAVQSDVYLAANMQRVGRQSTSTVPDPKEQKLQRKDQGKRRRRASDTETRVRKRRQLTGITSLPYVLPGVDEEYALDDPITEFEFELTHTFGGELSDDPIEDASDSEWETA